MIAVVDVWVLHAATCMIAVVDVWVLHAATCMVAVVDMWVLHAATCMPCVLTTPTCHVGCPCRMCELNVIRQTFNVCTSQVVQEAWDKGQDLTVFGLVYNLKDGIVRHLVGPLSSLVGGGGRGSFVIILFFYTSILNVPYELYKATHS